MLILWNLIEAKKDWLTPAQPSVHNFGNDLYRGQKLATFHLFNSLKGDVIILPKICCKELKELQAFGC